METKFRLYRHGRQWYVRAYVAGHDYRRPVCPIDGCAEDQAREKAAAIVRGIAGQLRRAADERESQNPFTLYKTRLATRTESYRANCARYQARLIQFFGLDKEVHSFTRRDVESWRDWLLAQRRQLPHRAGRLSPKTVKEHIDWLAAVFLNAGLPNPCAGVERPSLTPAERQMRVQFFSPDEMRELFAAVEGRRFENAFRFLAFTGCRVDEARRLRPQDCDDATRIVYVVGKGAKRRPLRLSGPCAPAWDALQAEYEERGAPAPSGRLFPQGSLWFYKSLARAARRAGIAHAHPHMLRHTFASMALLHWSPPWPLPTLAKWLGHADINTTYRLYSHWIAAEAPSAWGEDVKSGSGFRTNSAQRRKLA